MRVYPVPLVRESSLRCVCVAIRPGSTAAYGAVILGLDDLGEDRSRFGADEGFGHESNLVMYISVPGYNPGQPESSWKNQFHIDHDI